MQGTGSKSSAARGFARGIASLWLLGACCLASCSFSTQAPSTQAPVAANRIVIKSDWAGLSPDSPLETTITLVRAGDGYTLTGTISRHEQAKQLPASTIAAANVAQLLAAMKAPAQPQVDLHAIGLDFAQAQQVIDKQWNRETLATASPEIQVKAEALRQSLRQSGPLTTLIMRGLDGFHTDDYPRITVDAVLSDGSTLSAGSHSQQYLMLPWKSASGQDTYAPDIARALWNLLPEGAANKERLKGALDSYALDELVSAGLYEPQERLEAEAVAGNAMAALEGRFKVGKATVVQPFGKNGLQLGANLQLPDAPSNLVLITRLSIAEGALADSDRDIARIAAQLELVQTAPAMATRIKAAPATDFRIYDNFDRSWLDAKTTKQFIEQMQALHKLPELEAHPELLHDAVLVEEGFDPIYWVVLADHRAILWKQFTDAAATAGSQRCESLPMDDEYAPESPKGDLCIGEVFDADGNALP